MRRVTLIFLALALVPLVPARADDAPIGFVKTLSGAATVIRASDGVARPVNLAMPIHEHDQVETGSGCQLGITFRDDTRITLGPNSRVDLARFVFKPAERDYGFVMRIAYGTLQYLSGLTAKLAPDAMSIETPTSTIAVRGTRLLVRVENKP